jgi:hypothetical protein
MSKKRTNSDSYPEMSRTSESNSKSLEIHPLAQKFPDIPPKEFEELKVSVQTVGLLDPLIINDVGQVLEGRHRFKACMELGIEPRTLNWRDVLGTRFGQVSEAKFIFDANYHRRHLTDDQRVALCAAFLSELREEAKANQTTGLKRGRTPKRSRESQTRLTENPVGLEHDSPNTGKVSTKLANMAKVGRTKAEKVIDLADRDPGLLDQVSRGEKKLAEAHNQLEAKQPDKSATQRKLRSVDKYDYQKVDKQWLKVWHKFLAKYEPSCWAQVRSFVLDSIKSEEEPQHDAD